MMNEKGTSCQGCGTLLQSEHTDRAGYVPAHVLARSGGARCRRCYRLEHYGAQQATRDVDHVTVQEVSVNPARVQHVIATADAVLMVVDIWDFEGSFLPDAVSDAAGPVFVAVNKIDLLPARTPPHEVLDWVKKRFAEQYVVPEEVRLISAERGTSVKALLRAIEARVDRGGRVAMVGATNVGKSSLIQRWLPKQAARPATSALPGTTQQVMTHIVGHGGLNLLDTPGLVPGHRLSDFLCPHCAAVLVPKRRLKSKLVQLHKRNAIILGGLAALQVTKADQASAVTVAFASERVPIHVTRADRVLDLLRNGENTWLHTYCSSCRARIENSGWEDAQFVVKEGEDLVVPGLGWISPRKTSLHMTVTVPAGAQVFIRPRLVGTKGARRQR